MLSVVGVFNFLRYNLAFVLADFKIPCLIEGSRFIWFRLRVIVLARNDCSNKENKANMAIALCNYVEHDIMIRDGSGEVRILQDIT